jgi:glycosyltransferase involved in cell wall biosynthesis
MSATGAEPRVDVVINNYNYAHYLGAAIDSVRAQDHPELRLIVVDDGSSDDSRALIEARRAEIDEVVLKPNGGQASAINAGLERCRGDVVVFLDADDLLLPHAVSRLAAAFAADPGLAKVQARMEVIDGDGRRSGVLKPPPHLPMPSGELRQAELAYPFDLTWLPTSANAFRVEALRRLGPLPEERFRICADYYLVHLTPLLGRVASLPDVCSLYRVHGANNYELDAKELDLAHVRATIAFARATREELLRVAAENGFEHPRQILSIADLSNRMISLRLDPGGHPLPEGRLGLLRDSVVACRRRDNVSVAMKAMFVAWFAAMAAAPRALARPLAERFLFPERRGALNRVLGRLHRAEPEPLPERVEEPSR